MSTSLPLVSIVTPSFNQASFLRATIESVLAQDYPNIEYLVLDGGSTDGSVDIIREYAARIAYWSSQPDQGQADAINRAWQRSRGEIVSYLNSDDTLEPHAVRLSVQALSNQPEAGMSYGGCAWVDKYGHEIGRIYANPFSLADLLLNNRFAQPSVFIRRFALERAGMLDPSMHYMLDYDLWVRIALHFPAARVPEIISRFRLHDESKTASRCKFFLEDNLRLLDRAFNDPAFPADLRHLRQRAVNEAYTRAALHCYSLGQHPDGREIIHRFFETQAQPLAYPNDIIALFADHLVHYAPLRQQDFTPAKGVGWLDGILDDLPPNARSLAAFRSQILGRANIAWGFTAHARGDRDQARKHMLRALEYHPHYARNRGVWSVLVKSFKPSSPHRLSN